MSKKHNTFCIFDHGCNPKKDRKPAWRRTLANFTFVDKKLEKFGKIMTSGCFIVPLEDEYAPGEKYHENLKVESPEVIGLLPNIVVLEDKKPDYNKEKNKYVRQLCRSILIWYRLITSTIEQGLKARRTCI